jgi:alanine racemase
MEYRRAWAEIRLANIAHNMAALRRLYPAMPLMGIVKADAYGHGAVPVARCLLENGAGSLGVAICEEGIELRESGVDAPVLIMGFTPAPLLAEVVRLGLQQTIFSLTSAKELAAAAAKQGKTAAIHIKLDTGMSRLGFLPTDESINDICEIAQLPQLTIAGIYTHFATSDALEHEFMHTQRAAFAEFAEKLHARGVTIPMRHIANSGGVAQILRGGDIGEDIFQDAARLGIMLYGYAPSDEMIETVAPLGLRPAMRLMTQISMVKHLPSGRGISYGHMYKTTRPSVIAVLPVGYADGYPRRLSSGGQVLVRGQLAPIAGAICMDQCMADVTDIPGVEAGDPVAMLGSEAGITADCLARTVGTISYEILCGIGKRVPRVYI